MEYTVQALARLSGVTARTLRYYDEIGLLCPKRLSSNGYRIYSAAEVDRLQQILLYREMGLPLEQTAALLGQGGDSEATLQAHLAALRAEHVRLERLIRTVENTLSEKRGEINMTDEEKFEGFKRDMVEKNEAQHGAEARERYGDKAVDRSNKRLLNATQAEMQAIEALNAELNETLVAAMATGEPGGELAQKAADLHRQWLTFYWDSYSPEAHLGVTQMYVDDERFTAYYEKIAPGAARFLRDAVQAYCKA